MGIKKKILSLLCCTLLTIGGIGSSKSYANKGIENSGIDSKTKTETLLTSNMLMDLNKSDNNTTLLTKNDSSNGPRFQLEEGKFLVKPYNDSGYLHIRNSYIFFSYATTSYTADKFKFEYYPEHDAYLVKYSNRHLTGHGNYASMNNYTASMNQFWTIKYVGNNVGKLAFTLRNKATGQYLTKADDGVELRMANWYSTFHQAFLINNYN